MVGWFGPSVCFCLAKHSRNRFISSSSWAEDFQVRARFTMLVSVSGTRLSMDGWSEAETKTSSFDWGRLIFQFLIGIDSRHELSCNILAPFRPSIQMQISGAVKQTVGGRRWSHDRLTHGTEINFAIRDLQKCLAHDADLHYLETNQCLYCHQIIHVGLFCPAKHARPWISGLILVLDRRKTQAKRMKREVEE